MTLASQGIFLPKNQLKQHFIEAHASLKHVAEEVKRSVDDHTFQT